MSEVLKFIHNEKVYSDQRDIIAILNACDPKYVYKVVIKATKIESKGKEYMNVHISKGINGTFIIEVAKNLEEIIPPASVVSISRSKAS